MTVDRKCQLLAFHFLQDYALTMPERKDYAESLAKLFQQVAETELEKIAHLQRPMQVP